MMKIALLVVFLTASGVVRSQQKVSPNMVQNTELTKYLNDKPLKTECSSKGFEKALNDIQVQDLTTYIITEHRIAKEDYDTYSDDPVVKQALKAAFATPNVVQFASADPNVWVDNKTTKNVQAFVYAISNDVSIDYYRLEFHLNTLNALVDSKENYIGAAIYFACATQKEWIQEYQKP